MTVALFASRKLPLSEIVGSLSRGGISISSFVLTPQFGSNEIPLSVTECILIANEAGVVNIGEQAEQIRELIGQETPLVLCIPQPAAPDRKVLKQCGASEIITPQSWNSRHVGERLLGQMIVSGVVKPQHCGQLYGGTSQMQELYSDIEKLAPLSEPILILGETGTGKELVARELHERSGRQNTYLPINCPEIQPDLISSELFGHEKGAFTGADKARMGLIGAAGSGTVFLDEIGDLDLQSQAKLLRVLEERKVRRVGANHFEDVKARVILATNRDLEEACAVGKFRRDLHERIRGFSVQLPPLRNRKADIPILVTHFVDEYNLEYKTDYKLPAGGVDYLFHHDWPGNVRELRALVRRAAAYSDSHGFISFLILQESVQRPKKQPPKGGILFDPAVDTWRDLVSRTQSIYFEALLAHTNGNRETAIKLSGLGKSQFFEKLKELSKDSK